MTKQICVIGAGLAGGIIASRMAEKGYDVNLIDMGDKADYIRLTDEEWNFDKPKAAFTRGQGLGGTSNFWHGGLTYLDRSDIDDEAKLFSQKKYPISQDKIYYYYKKAFAILSGELDVNFNDIQAPPKSDENDFEIDNEWFKYKGLLYPKRAFNSKILINDAVKKYGLSVSTGFIVESITMDSSGNVSHINSRNKLDGTFKKFKADIYVLSAGGIGSPKILLNSTSDCSQLKPLPIGKYITDHPTGFVFKAKLSSRLNLKSLFGQTGQGYRSQYGFTLNHDKLPLVNDRNHILFLRPAISMKDPLIYDFLKRKLVVYKGKRVNPTDVLYLFKHLDLLYEAVNFKFGLFNKTRYVSGLTFLEQFPTTEDSISIESGNNNFQVNWRVSDQDEISSKKFLDLFFQNHKHHFEEYKIFPNIRKRLETSGHHSGGCRMAEIPENGVVDMNLKVFNSENLFVADGSVLPYTGHANTGLSIAAMALKCCDSILEY